MDSLLRISEAASLALHAMLVLSTRAEERLSTREIAQTLGGSEAHLSKVLQRLVKAGFVCSTPGRNGGFALPEGKGDPSLLEVYEVIEGRLAPVKCLLGKPICGGKCILGDLVATLNAEVKQHLGKTRISDLRNTYGSRKGGTKKDHSH